MKISISLLFTIDASGIAMTTAVASDIAMTTAVASAIDTIISENNVKYGSHICYSLIHAIS